MCPHYKLFLVGTFFCILGQTSYGNELLWGTVDGTKAKPTLAGGEAFWRSVDGKDGTYVFVLKKSASFVQASCFLEGGGFDAPSCLAVIVRDPDHLHIQVRTYLLEQTGQGDDVHTTLTKSPAAAFVSITAGY